MRDSAYAAVFDGKGKWPQKAYHSVLDDPANSALFTEGNHETASDEKLGNSWLRVGSRAKEWLYLNVIGISWEKIRHQEVMPLMMFDGSSSMERFIPFGQFNSTYGSWVENY